MFKRIALALVLVLASMGVTRAAEWTVDAPHSSVQFKVSHLVISKVVGSFKTFSATLNFDTDNLAAGSVEMAIDVSSIDTDNGDRDQHLKSADFFETENFPQMTFKSTKVSAGKGSEFQLTGDLTIKGVTNEVTFDCVFNGATDFMGTTKSGFTAEATIDRQSFGLTWSRALETGGLVVGNDVDITLELEFNQAS